MKYVYCAGSFTFDSRDPDYRERACQDYRARLLGGVSLLLQRQAYVPLKEDVHYIGPFYFETDGMQDVDIVASEMDMIRACTDAIFLLEGGNCPGTIAEMVLAASLGKRLHVVCVVSPEGEETESTLHTPCWYPILLCSRLQPLETLAPCPDHERAVERILQLAASL